MWSRRRWMWAGAVALSAVRVRAVAAERLSLRTAAGRSVDVSVWSAGAGPSARGAILRGAILFSHGARSAPWKYDALIEPWRAAGWDVYAPLHVDSTDHPDTASFAGLASWPARIEDMRALAEHLGPRGCVAAGHSYGGLVALALGGAAPMPPPGIEGPLRDPRVRCVLAFSPPGPQPPLIGPQAYASLSVPAFIQTGDLDVPPGAPPGAWQQHLAAYEAAPARGDRYALVLEGVDHYFGGLIGRPELPGPRPAAAFAAAIEMSTLFLRAYGVAGSTASLLEARLNAEGAVRLMRK